LTEGTTTSGGRTARALRTFRYSLAWGALRRQKAWLIWGFVFLVFGAIATLLSTQAAVAVVDQGIDKRTAELTPLIVRLVVLSVFGFGIGVASKLISERIGYQLQFDLRNLLYLRLQKSRPQDLDRFATGQIVTRSLTDLTLLEYFIRIVSGVVALIPVFVGFTLFLLVSNPVLTLLTCSAYVINGFLVNKIRHRLWGLSFVGLDQSAKVTAAIDEPVRGIRVVKSFAREEDERGRVATLAARMYQFTLTRVRLESRYDLILRAAPVGIRALLVLLGARFVVSGSLSLGQFLIFFQFTQIGVTIATFLDEGVSAYQYVKTGAGRITELLRTGSRGAKQAFEPMPEPSSGLELHRVAVVFADTTAVADVSLAVPPGTLTFLTGPPGSGKSTIAGLASGSLVATEGTILLDGVDITRLDPQEVSRAVHLVSEEPFLFARTLRENLTIGALAAGGDEAPPSDDDLLAAIHAAGATDVVQQLRRGLDEPLGDRGMTLSGGQRQRLALARALVRPPRLLVLDDALSAVSPALEVDVLRRIREHAPATGVLCIGRRPGPQALAETVITLPAPEQRRVLETVGASTTQSAADTAAALARAMGSVPYDDRLVDIIAKLQFTDDKPRIGEDEVARDERPTIGGVLRPFTSMVVSAVVLTILLQAIGLIPEYVFGEVGDYVREGNTSATDKLSLGIAAVAIATGLFTYLFRIVKGQATNGVLYVLRRRIFGRLSRLGVDYYDRELPGQVATRVVHDLDQIERFLGKGSATEGVYEAGGHITKFFLALAIIVFLSPPVGLIVFGFVIVMGVISAVQMPLANRALGATRVALGDVISRLQEDFAGRYVIKSFGAERQARQDYGAAARRYRRAQRRSENVGAVYSEVIDLVGKLASAAVFWRAGHLALAGAISVGTVLQLRLFLTEALRPLTSSAQLTRIFYDTLRARVSFAQIGSMWDVPILPTTKPDASPCGEVEGELAFEAVSFGYPGTDRPVLHDLSFRASPGDRVAIVGYTGAGKSSIAKLITRMYDPDAGRITVDGTDIRDLELTSYRRRIGVVPQEAFLFTGTIAANIAYGRPDATPAEIEAAVRAAGAYDVLMAIEGGLDAPVEEEARNLTAGERQLVAIARAVLAGPDVLVLDEATASLDAETEAKVMDAVLDLGLTTILVTHRLAVAERADFSIMVEAGRIVEAGTHRELVGSDRAYAELWGHATIGPTDSARRRRRARRTTVADHAPRVAKRATKKAAEEADAKARQPVRKARQVSKARTSNKRGDGATKAAAAKVPTTKRASATRKA
jgi:ATP-binding cassette subfamily B protein